MNRRSLFAVLFSLTAIAYSQNDTVRTGDSSSLTNKPTSHVITTLKIGYGLEYGFLGANLTIYPLNNLGLSGGAGILPYEGTHFMYNAGIKINFKPGYSSNKWGIEALYGTNTLLKDYNKVFRGTSLGLYHESDWKKFNYYFGILFTFKSSELKDFMDDNGIKEVYYGVPIKFALGIGFVL